MMRMSGRRGCRELQRACGQRSFSWWDKSKEQLESLKRSSKSRLEASFNNVTSKSKEQLENLKKTSQDNVEKSMENLRSKSKEQLDIAKRKSQEAITESLQGLKSMSKTQVESAKHRAKSSLDSLQQKGLNSVHHAKDLASSHAHSTAKKIVDEASSKTKSISSKLSDTKQRVSASLDPNRRIKQAMRWVAGVVFFVAFAYGAGATVPYAVRDVILELDHRRRQHGEAEEDQHRK